MLQEGFVPRQIRFQCLVSAGWRSCPHHRAISYATTSRRSSREARWRCSPFFCTRTDDRGKEWHRAPRYGAKGKRFCLPNSRVLIHQPLGESQGPATDIEIHAKEILYLRQRLNDIMAKHTGQDMKTIEHDTDRDNFFGADEAVNYGLVDKVLVNRAEVGT